MDRFRHSRILVLGALAVLSPVALAPGQTGPDTLARAQAPTSATPGQPIPPAAWASSGATAVQGDPSGRKVIATSRKVTASLPSDARLPLPDDGLRPVSATMPSPRPLSAQATEVARPLTPTPGVIQPAIYSVPVKTDGDLEMGRPASLVSRGNTLGQGLNVELLGPETGAPGQALNYQLIVRNTGVQVLCGVRVELPLPGKLRLLSSKPEVERNGDRLVWRLGNLSPEAEQRFTFEVQTSQPGFLDLRPMASFAAAIGLRCNIVRPAFSLTVNAPESATVGEKIALQIEVGNHSPEHLRKVTLRCDLGPKWDGSQQPRSSGLTHPQGQAIEAELPEVLAPGQVRTIRLEDILASKPGKHAINLTATADGGRVTQAVAMVQVCESCLTLVNEGPRQANVGQELTYQMELSNPGKQDVAGVNLTQILPDGLEFVGASSGGNCNPSTQTINWALPVLLAGQKQNVTFQVRARQAGDWAMHTTARGPGTPDVRGTHALRIEAAPSLSLDVTAHDNSIAVGSETLYEVRIYNQGPVTTRMLGLTIGLPEGMLGVHAEGPTRWQIRGQQILFEPMAEMQARMDVVYRVRVRGASPGEGRFRVEVNASGLTQPLVREATTRVNATGLVPVVNR